MPSSVGFFDVWSLHIFIIAVHILSTNEDVIHGIRVFCGLTTLPSFSSNIFFSSLKNRFQMGDNTQNSSASPASVVSATAIGNYSPMPNLAH